MKSINDLIISEDQEAPINAKDVSAIGKKIDKLFADSKNRLMEMLEIRERNWELNKFSWSREPMFLVFEPSDKLTSKEHPRNLAWIRMKFMKGNQDSIKGTFKTYNIEDEEGKKPNSVIGIYYDKKFQFITSLSMFNKIYDLLDSEK